ncbi:MAG: 2-oxoglutarate dehydrogenase E1 component [Caldilineaceae bacterium]
MTSEELFHGPNLGYVLDLYERYLQDPSSVDAEMQQLFARWKENGEGKLNARESAPAPLPVTTLPSLNSPQTYDVTHAINTARLIRYIRELGHLEARIDPLGSEPPGDLGLRLDIQGVTEEDLELLPASIVRGPLVEGTKNAKEGVERLRAVYSDRIAYETDHIQDYEERTWLREAFEDRRFFANITAERKRDLLERLSEVEGFERFLHSTFVGQKRFSIEGCDMLVPMLDSIIRNAASDGTREVVIGMAHRGRLNVLAHVLGKPYADILGEFYAMNRDGGMSASGRGLHGWTGDVKYHLGARRAYKDAGIDQMPITLAPNPSHLEFVNPVVEGRARAAQEKLNERGEPVHDRMASLPIVIHGDAAFPGQGIVAETLNLSGVKGYSTGGTIHIVVNNQIGFTTLPSDSRSTLYASDLAKGFEIPIVHVNADDPVGCLAMARLAWAYRHLFGKDFLIDLVGYRRWGHNEGDEPTFTQPLMYQKIASHPTVRELWAKQLAEEGIVSAAEADALVTKVRERLRAAQKQAENSAPHLSTPPASNGNNQTFEILETAVSGERLRELNEALLERPTGFAVNEKLERALQRRHQISELERSIEWAHAESLAFASILADGTPIRLTGQDSQRGTFGQRNLVLHDVRTDKAYIPLQNLPQGRAAFSVLNSSLSENAVLGFEYGYSMHAPHVLVLWEAQFGDFANGAQVIIDQFIVSGRAKWAQTPSLVLLLPHGYEGQGPEHSSARLERFLQLCAADNIRVVNCTTAAQYFHLLRRQAATLNHDPRPLVVMTPKSLLRSPQAASTLSDLATGRFQSVLAPSPSDDPKHVTRLVLCSGKIYVDLLNSKLLEDASTVAVARVEELYPFPEAEIRAVADQFPKLEEIVWMQEEPANMGAWSFVFPRLLQLSELPIYYAGRQESASPAEGAISLHVPEQQRILQLAMQGKFTERKSAKKKQVAHVR